MGGCEWGLLRGAQLGGLQPVGCLSEVVTCGGWAAWGCEMADKLSSGDLRLVLAAARASRYTEARRVADVRRQVARWVRGLVVGKVVKVRS